MAYNTGNPSGSSDPRDLSDSSADIDTWATSTTADTHPDRLGVQRKTWRGMENEFDADQDSREAQFVQLMVSGGYTGTGAGGAVEEYAPGITVSAYKEIIRDSGEFWRASADTTLPYTTTGAGMPEGGAFVNVGDGVLRQDLVQPVATFNNVADMKASPALGIGRKARTLGYYAPGDGGGNDYEIVAAATGSSYGFLFEQLTGSGLEAKLLGGGVMEDKTVYIPSDYATLQSAFDDLSEIKIKQTATITVMIETGHVLSQALSLSGGDFSQFIISSVDAEVSVTTPTDVRFLRFDKCNAPTINVILNGTDVVEELYRYTRSRGQINSGCGGKNTYGRILYVNGTSLRAGGTVWDTYEEIFCTGGASTSLGAAIMKNATRASVVFAEGSTGDVVSSDIQDCAIGIHVKDGAVIDSEFAVIRRSTDEAVRVDDATITLDRAQLLDCQQEGVNILSGNVSGPNMTITSDGVTSGESGIKVYSGSHWLSGTSISGFISGISQIGCSVLEAGSLTVTSRTAGVGNGVLCRYSSACNITDSVITGFDNDIRTLNGGIVSAFGVETTSSASSLNYPDVNDTEAGGNGGFNSILIGAKGIIWA